MSGQWEVVGKKKERSSKLPIPSSQESGAAKKAVKNGVKIEEVLSKDQVKNLYASKGNKENKKPAEKKSPSQQDAKKSQPKVKTDKPPQEPKPKTPKSIESALTNIPVEELKLMFEKSCKTFPDTPIISLKDVVTYLNQKITLEIDPIFSNKPVGYPLSVMPAPLKNFLESSIKQAGPENTQLFFDISLQTMALHMSTNKNGSAIGSKIYLQLMALNDPSICTSNLPKRIVMLKSYVNRAPIGQSICWALGQSGLKDFNAGLKIFHEIMLPLLELKHYSKFVVKYLVDLINRHKKAAMTKEQYFTIVDMIQSPKKNFPVDLNKDLLGLLPILNEVLLGGGSVEKMSTLFEPLMKRLQTGNRQSQDSVCETIVTCLAKDNHCFGSWGKCYAKNLSGSSILLNYLVHNWKITSTKLNRNKLEELLKTFSLTNEELMTKKYKEDGLLTSISAINTLTKKMASKKSGGCPCRFFMFLIILATSGWICYDVQQNGSWNNSCTSKALNHSGVYEYTNKALDHAQQGTLWVQNRIEEKFPGISENAREFSAPYLQLCSDLRKVVCNMAGNLKEFADEKYPEVLKQIDHYAPGLIDNTQNLVKSTWISVLDYKTKTVTYLTEQVFVGKLSPENMRKVVGETTSLIREKSTDYFYWIYEKIQSTIK